MDYGSGHAPPPAQQEMVFLNEPGLQVTTARLVVGYRTYPIAAMTSFAPFTVTADTRGPHAALVLGLVVNVGAIIGKNICSESEGGGFIAAAMLSTIVFLWGLHQALRRQTVHGISVVMSGIQLRVFADRDIGRVHRVVGALNQVVASR